MTSVNVLLLVLLAVPQDARSTLTSKKPSKCELILGKGKNTKGISAILSPGQARTFSNVGDWTWMSKTSGPCTFVVYERPRLKGRAMTLGTGLKRPIRGGIDGMKKNTKTKANLWSIRSVHMKHQPPSSCATVMGSHGRRMTYPAGAYPTVPALRNIHKIRGKRCILKVWNAEHYGTRTSRVYAKSFDGPPSASPFKLKSPALSFKLVRSAPDCLTVRQKEVRRCVQLQIETWQALKTPSVASGTLENGALQYPSKLPDSSFGYRIIERDPVRHREYGHDRMVFGLVDLGAVMHQRLSGTDDERRFAVGDISTANGGPQREPPPHQNHQMGLDVDLGLYMTNYLGRRFSYIRDINADGRSTDGDYTFDAAANWALVKAMLTSPYFGRIRIIIIAEHLRTMMLQHARRGLKIMVDRTSMINERKLIEQADALMKDTGGNKHNNHFHVSLSQ